MDRRHFVRAAALGGLGSLALSPRRAESAPDDGAMLSGPSDPLGLALTAGPLPPPPFISQIRTGQEDDREAFWRSVWGTFIYDALYKRPPIVVNAGAQAFGEEFWRQFGDAATVWACALALQVAGELGEIGGITAVAGVKAIAIGLREATILARVATVLGGVTVTLTGTGLIAVSAGIVVGVYLVVRNMTPGKVGLPTGTQVDVATVQYNGANGYFTSWFNVDLIY